MKKIPKVLLLVMGVMLALGAIAWGWIDHVETPSPSPQPPLVSDQPMIQIVAFGDSLTAGYNLALDDAYPAQLERLLRERGYAVEVINAGVSGETSAGGVRRASFIRSLNPDIVLFGLGGNDALRLLPEEALEQNLEAALQTLLAGPEAPRVLLLGMRAPANADRTYRVGFDQIYPRVAKRFAVPLIPFWLEGVALDPRYTLPDGIHPNREGYAKVIEAHILPALLPLPPPSGSSQAPSTAE